MRNEVGSRPIVQQRQGSGGFYQIFALNILVMSANIIPEPWKSFLNEVDEALTQEVLLHCLGGFVIRMLYDRPVPTADIDVVHIVPQSGYDELMRLAGEGSKLYDKYDLYFQLAGIAKTPDDYEARLKEMFEGAFKHLRLYALDPYDIALTKIERNSSRDREDVQHLARKVPFDLQILKDRYEKEQRHNVANPLGREDTTLQLWLDMIREEREET
jgi:hypothetical protein